MVGIKKLVHLRHRGKNFVNENDELARTGAAALEADVGIVSQTRWPQQAVRPVHLAMLVLVARPKILSGSY